MTLDKSLEIGIEIATDSDRRTGFPRACPSTKNWTVPVGIPVAGAFGATVALKVPPEPDGVTGEVDDGGSDHVPASMCVVSAVAA